jgi:surface polysaccharide O-acyltransferase-like enzyme
LNASSRIVAIDALKGLAILGVLFIHMAFTSRFDAGTLGKVHLLQAVFGWCVLAFFFASGFLHRSSGATSQDWNAFISKRARRLLVPCVAFSWAYKAMLLAAHRAGFMESGALPSFATPADALRTMLTPAAPQFYFLADLFIIAVAVQLLIRIPAFERPLSLLLLAAALVQTYWLLPLEKPHGEALSQIPLYAATYLLGFQTARIDRGKGLISLLRDPGFLVFGASIASLSLSKPQVLHIGIPVLLFALMELTPRLAALPLTFLGRHSGAVYAWHTPIVMPAISIVVAKSPLTGWPLILVITVSTLAVCLVLDSVVRRIDKAGYFRL